MHKACTCAVRGGEALTPVEGPKLPSPVAGGPGWHRDPGGKVRGMARLDFGMNRSPDVHTPLVAPSGLRAACFLLLLPRTRFGARPAAA